MRGILRSGSSDGEKRDRGRTASQKKVGRSSRVRGSWWFVPVQATPPKAVVRVRLNRTVLDEMAAISATPIGLEDIEVAVGVEGMRQDWQRVGTYLRTAMEGLDVDVR